MLEIRNLEKKFRNTTVFSNCTMSMTEGNLYILQGVNGSGKSTLIKILAGLLYKTDGSIIKSGTISYLPDKFSMPRLLKVNTYLSYVFKENIQEIEQDVTLFSLPNKRIGDLSKGNLMKVGIIQALHVPAEIYIFDEPTDGLDEASRKIFKEKIKEKLEQNKIVLLSSHQKNIFSDLKPMVIEVKEGCIHEKKKKTKD